MKQYKYIKRFNEIGINDIPLVGGKNASLGEMIVKLSRSGIRVPDGFATTSNAFREFIRFNKLDLIIFNHLKKVEKNIHELQKAGKTIRNLIIHGEFPQEMKDEILVAYSELSKKYITSPKNNDSFVDVAVRSSATAEDLPDASFAGQQETFLNISGNEELLSACKRCFASLFTDRAISYRITKGFDHMKVALSVGIQKMVRSDLAGSGVMFSIDTENGFPDAVVISAAWGLGENVVQGEVTPDEYRAYKPFLNNPKLSPIIQKTMGAKEKKMIYATGRSQTTKNINTTMKEKKSFVLNDKEILELARWAQAIEKHYNKPMDMEWAKDKDGKLFIVQARPETVQSRKEQGVLKSFKLLEKGKTITTGLAIGEGIVSAKAQVIRHVGDIKKFKPGSILITEITDPDWGPVMKQAAGIITDHGGRTSHAAIISRELGIPAIVGCGNATDSIKNGSTITLSCAGGDTGTVFEGNLKFKTEILDIEKLPKPKTNIKINIASPEAAFKWWKLPVQGIGLARMEFIITSIIKIHPMALLQPEKVKDAKSKAAIADILQGYPSGKDFFIGNLARGIAKLAASQYPDPVILRFSDFKTNEYAELIGGHEFEPAEENPMIGFRGASRYYSEAYKAGFAMECAAVKYAREVIGMDNIWTMIPFCRTLEEGDKVLAEMAKNGLKKGINGLKVYVMCEIPSNVLLAEEFADRFDGFSIGSNDLTQLTLGVDRDSANLSYLFDERNEAVKRMIREVIRKAHKKGKEVGICGQAPSDYPDFAEFLVEEGIDSISLNPDSVVETIKRIVKLETKLNRK